MLRRTGSGWSIDLDTADAAFEDGMSVQLVVWDDRDADSRSEVERIALVQQLPVDIVALELSAEGSLATNP